MFKKKKKQAVTPETEESKAELEIGFVKLRMKFWQIIVLLVLIVALCSVGFSIKGSFFSMEKDPVKLPDKVIEKK